MKKRFVFTLLTVFIFLISFSQNNSLWEKATQSRYGKSELENRTSTVKSFNLYKLNLEELKSRLQNTINQNANSKSSAIIEFPSIDGKMERYKVYNASIMEPEFARKHTEIQSYAGINVNKPNQTIRFTTTVFGLHAVIHSEKETIYIDPYSKDLNTYLLYSRSSLSSDEERLKCHVENTLGDYTERNNGDRNFRSTNDGTLRVFRLALACTQEYANFHINAAGQSGAPDTEKRAIVLAAMNVTMTRVNAIFERDLSLRMQLVDNTSIIFLEEDDGYTNSSTTGELLNENVTIVNANIGIPNYDIGHVFSTSDGGAAFLGRICYDDLKAGGFTGLPNPVGDPFDVDYVAHEFGHQFGANHTFNGGQGSCSGTSRNQATAVEPGSGTTIMGYAGICNSDNVQGNSNDYFHAISIGEIFARITSSTEPVCSVNTTNGNSPPTVDAGQDYVIPFGTAFMLSGSASDIDGDQLTYCWEQVNTGTNRNQPNTTSTTNPQFRSFSPTLSSDRTFPQLNDILNGNLTPQWEVIPDVARSMDFALTVRDNQLPNGGQTNRDDMRVTLANTGPFVVTSPDVENISYPSGSTNTITWDVAGTDGNGINTSSVNILLSTDGGQTFNETLASNTPNDGSETISFPLVNEPFCRIKIEPVDNIFFAISQSFSIGAQINCNVYSTGLISEAIPEGNGPNVPGSSISIPLDVSETDSITDLKVNMNITHGYVGDLEILLQAPNGLGTIALWNRTCNSAQFQDIDVTFEDGNPDIDCGNPTSGTYSPVEPISNLNGINPSGRWNLVLRDFFNQDAGTVNEWSIELCSVELNTGSFGLTDLSIYPNPSDGDFTLRFNSNSGNNVNISIYDVSGKLVDERNYEPNAVFQETLSLENISTGMYFIRVNDHDNTITRKLLIN